MVPTVPLTSGEWRSPWRVWSRSRSPVLVVAVGCPPRTGDRRPGDGAGVGEAAADAIGEVFGLGVGDDEGDRVLGAVGDDVGGDGVGHRPSGVLGGGAGVFPSVVAAQLLRGERVAAAQEVEGVAVVGVDLAAVDGQLGGGNGRGRRRGRSISAAIPPAFTAGAWRGSPRIHS